MKRKEKAHKENNNKSVWFCSSALYSLWSEFLHFLIMFSRMISSCAAFCKHCNRASLRRRDTTRAQHQCLNKHLLPHWILCELCPSSYCALGSVGLPYALCLVLQALADTSALFSGEYYLRSDFSDQHRRVRWDKAWGKAT